MRPKHLIAILVLLALTLPASPAQAGGTVEVCDEAHLTAALAGGGTVTFACSGEITLTQTINITADTTIDGSGQAVTISGDNAVQVLYVSSGVGLNLNELTIADGYAGGGGGMLNDGGAITVTHSTFAGNRAQNDGGGILNEGGAMIVTDSSFTDNSNLSSDGAGIYNHGGVITVTHSTFSDNSALNGGGIATQSGRVTVTDSTFTGNSASNGGAAIDIVWSTITISNSAFNGNDSLGGGGGITNWGTLTVRDSDFSGNSARYGGGIASAAATLIVRGCTFSDNVVSDEGGGIFTYSGNHTTVSDSTFSGNRAGNGGGINNLQSEMSVVNSTFFDNSALNGGGILTNSGTFTVTNSTFIGNRATGVGGYGGGIYDEGGLIVSNSTFSGNSADYGGGLFYYTGTGILLLTSTIVADSPGGNCFGTLSDGGGNLGYPVEDTSCPADIRSDPLLGPLQDNGGPTHTMALGPGSPAIDSGEPSNCPETDQRGVPRPVDGDGDGNAICDIGAFEFQHPTVTAITDDDPDPSQSGEPFTVAVSVASTTTLDAPTGVVTVTVSNSPATCSASLADGTGSCELAIADSGAYTLTAEYSGAGNFFASSDTEPHTVIPKASLTTITADDPDPSLTGEPFTVTFSVTSTTSLVMPTGLVTVTVSDSPAACGALLVDGSGSCELEIADPGAYTLTASYEGMGNLAPSSDTEPHTVIPAIRQLFLPMVSKDQSE